MLLVFTLIDNPNESQLGQVYLFQIKGFKELFIKWLDDFKLRDW